MTTRSTSPDVSVIVAAWRAAPHVQRAIDSALASSGVSVEVVVVDDASPDATFAVLNTLAKRDSRIVIDRLAANGGPSAARNRAIELSTGRFVAVLDADDAIAPERLAGLIATAQRTGADIVVDNMIETDPAGQPLASTPFLRSPSFAADREIDLATWIACNEPMKPGDCLGYLKPLIRRDVLTRLGVQYDAGLRNSEDYYFIAELLAAGAHMSYLATAGYFYARSPSSTSHRLKPEHTRAWLEAESRFRARHANPSDPIRKALDRRGRALRNVHQFVAATDALKAKRPIRLAAALASDLRAAAYTLGEMSRIAMAKVRKTAG